MTRTFSASLAALFLTILCVSAARAADVTVVGLFGGKAVLVVNGGKPRTLSAGQTADGVKLVSATSEAAVIEMDGKRQTLGMGHATRISSAPSGSSGAKVTLKATSGGHFMADGSINGVPVRFLVDTGATAVAISTGEARRVGINYLAGRRVMTSTANGSALAYVVQVDNVRVGEIALNNVDVLVGEGMSSSPFALLGMSFLNRTQMLRDGDTLTLVRRY